MPSVTLEYGRPGCGEYPPRGEVVLCLYGRSLRMMEYDIHELHGQQWHGEGDDYWTVAWQPWLWVRLPEEWMQVCRLDWRR